MDFFSREILKTVISFFQVVQAVVAIIENFSSVGTYTPIDGINGVFIPLVVISLFRLYVTSYLTDDFAFAIEWGPQVHSCEQSRKLKDDMISIYSLC